MSSGQCKSRRRNLYGPACETSRRVLSEQVSRLCGQNLEHFVETKGGHSLLCYECNAKLHRFSVLDSQLTELRDYMGAYISAFHPISVLSTATVPAVGQKRAVPTSELPSKQPRLDPQTLAEHTDPSTFCPISVVSTATVPAVGQKRVAPTSDLPSKQPRLDPQTQAEHTHASISTQESPGVTVSFSFNLYLL